MQMNSLMSAAICLEIVRIKLATCVNNIVTYENCDSNDTLRLAHSQRVDIHFHESKISKIKNE
jgi:hypothetical protein